ncbi:MAG TPA: hypothetical protein VH024_17515 [Candidatus Angelobacter sp.]|jgi:hypothetical protein|nr:hypothetical protein [Candidatus Angelobacter sp.]
MPFRKLTLRPGVNVQRTQTLNQGGWSFSNLIRFKEGLPETVGGWTAFLQSALQGAIRALHAWATLASTASLGIGTNLRLYVVQGDQSYDITPIVAQTTPSSPITTISGQSIVTITDPSIAGLGLTVGSFVEWVGGSPINAVSLSGEYTVLSVPTSGTYTIDSGIIASGSGVGGGTPTISYLLPIGTIDAGSANGWGSGAWGEGTWGTPRAGGSTGITLPRLWSLDNWGENLIANPRGRGIYQWVAATGTSVRSAVLTNAPTISNQIAVASPLQMLLAFGCSPPAGGAQDPMLVAWSDVGNNTNWTPTAANQAGSFRLTNGSQIMQAVVSQQQVLVWTDTTLYGMQYLGAPLVWGFTQLGASCGAISPNAVGIFGGFPYWMSNFEFWMYNGTVQQIDCSLRDQVFKNLNVAQASKIITFVNTQHSEVSWFYPSAQSTENDSYVTINLDQQPPIWYGGSLSRTAAIDNNVFGGPLAADATGNIWSHEVGYAAAGAAMPWKILSGFVDLAEGEEYIFVDMLIPDQIMTNGPVAYTVFTTNFPGDTPQQYGPFIVNSSTEIVPLRARARQIAFQVDNSLAVVGSFWRHGAVRARATADGRQ